jgi:hypothetical protein
MRIKWISGVVVMTLAVALVSRLGSNADAAIRSHCTAIGLELRVRAAKKAKEMAALRKRGADPVVMTQWDVYISHVDAMGRTLIDNFSEPEPPRPRDTAAVRRLDLDSLTHAGEGCTG